MKALIWIVFVIVPLFALSQRERFPDAWSPLTTLRLNSGYGYRVHPLTGKPKLHTGIDLAARGDTVYAIMSGVVDFAGYDRGLGLHVVLAHGATLQSIYGHLSQFWVLKDDTVGVGEPIGLTGATGLVTGEHLHFSIKFNNRFLNPLAFLKSVLQRAASHYSLNYANHE